MDRQWTPDLMKRSKEGCEGTAQVSKVATLSQQPAFIVWRRRRWKNTFLAVLIWLKEAGGRDTGGREHWRSARAAGLMSDGGSAEVDQRCPWDRCRYGCRRCQWHIVKHSDELCVSTSGFSSVPSTKASGSNDAASSDPTHSTGAVLMTLSCILSPIFPSSSSSDPSPLSGSSHSSPMPGYFQHSGDGQTPPPSHTPVRSPRVNPIGPPRESTHLPSRPPTSARIRVLPLGLQHGHGSRSLLHPAGTTYVLGRAKGIK